MLWYCVQFIDSLTQKQLSLGYKTTSNAFERQIMANEYSILAMVWLKHLRTAGNWCLTYESVSFHNRVVQFGYGIIDAKKIQIKLHFI